MLVFDPKSFSEKFPKEVEELILLVMRKGFSLTLIGGAVRDFLSTGMVGKDLDFELKHSMEFSSEEWKSRLNLLKKEIQKQWKCEELAFKILRVTIGEYELEFSSARKETYVGEGPFAHSDFEVVLDPSLNILESIQRRDFTLNSIGIHFGAPGTNEEYELVDPSDGLTALNNKELIPAGNEFYKDPVRMLRTLRFHLKYGYSYKSVDFSRFDLSLLTVHWLLTEAKKSGKQEFFARFFDLIEENTIVINEKITSLEPLKKLKGNNWDGGEDCLLIGLLQVDKEISKELFTTIGTILTIPHQFISSLWEIGRMLQEIQTLDVHKLKSLNSEDFSNSIEFKLIKSLHQFESKYPSKLSLIDDQNYKALLGEFFKIWPIGFEQGMKKPDYNSLAPSLRASCLFKQKLDV